MFANESEINQFTEDAVKATYDVTLSMGHVLRWRLYPSSGFNLKF